MLPLWKETPHGARATVVALPGPPTPPATVVMVPGAVAAWAPRGAAAAPAPPASAVPRASAAAAPVTRIRADLVRLLITAGCIGYPLRLCVPEYRRAPAGDPARTAGPLVRRGTSGTGLRANRIRAMKPSGNSQRRSWRPGGPGASVGIGNRSGPGGRV